MNQAFWRQVVNAGLRVLYVNEQYDPHTVRRDIQRLVGLPFVPIDDVADVSANNLHELFTSMFVERMEVLEYRQKFEVELSTFPDSTNTKTPRKLVFSLTCVCVCVCLSVCVCEKVCQWISYERVDRFR